MKIEDLIFDNSGNIYKDKKHVLLYSALGEVLADLQTILSLTIDRNGGWDDEVSEKLKELIQKCQEAGGVNKKVLDK